MIEHHIGHRTYRVLTRCGECGKAIGGETGNPDWEVWTHVVEDNSHHPVPPPYPQPQRVVATHNEPILVPYVWRHLVARWPNATTPERQVMKVAEEAGEACGALIKLAEGRKTEQDVRDELADTIIAAIGALQARGADAAETVFDRWAGVVIR